MKKSRALACLIVVLSLTGFAVAKSETIYSAMFLDGGKIGYSKLTRTVTGGRVTTEIYMKMTMDRLGVSLSITQEETSVETAAGKPISFVSKQSFGAMGQEIRGKIIGGKLEITTAMGGQQQVRTIDWPAGAVMAEGARLARIKNGLAEGTTYTVKVFMPPIMSAMDAQITVGPKVKVDLLGRVVMLTEVKTTSQSMMGSITETGYVDDDFTIQKSLASVGGMMIEGIVCDEAFALSPDNPKDILDKLLLTSPVPLAIESAKMIQYTLKSRSGESLVFPVTDSQKVTSRSGPVTSLTVSPAKATPGQKMPYKGSDKDAIEALKPTMYVQSGDPKIKALARQAIGDATDAAVAAKRIEKFVNGYISEKNLAVGYASALEVALSKEGDCTEHALLTAALCQAAGIPAQVVAGVVYTESLPGKGPVFGPHAWVQAYAGGKWVGLDATSRRFGPGHITQSVGNGDPEGFFSLMNTMGKFDIVEAKVIK